MDFDMNKSLRELDGEDWGEHPFDSALVLRCTSLRHKPLRDLTAGDLRVMIGQQISLKFLVPIAIEFLLLNPYVQGELYPGDLFTSVLSVERSWWGSCEPWLLEQLNDVIKVVEDDMRTIRTLITDFRS